MIISSYCSPRVLWYKVNYDNYVSSKIREHESISDLIFNYMMIKFGELLSNIWMIGIKYSGLNWQISRLRLLESLNH